MPEIAGYRGQIERQLSQEIGLPVSIGGVSATWPGLHPLLQIDGLEVRDAAGRPALLLSSVDAEIAWSSLWHFGLRLRRLEIVAPSLEVRRDADGTILVAGLPVQGQATDTDYTFARWLLAQGRIVIRDARLVWHDARRAAPPLELQQLNFELRNGLARHQFGLTAQPPGGTASRVDLRGNWKGDDPADLASWRGALYGNLEGLDLQAWSPWVDLPQALSRGQGKLKFWVDFAQLQPTGFSADLQLSDVVAHLGDALPALDLVTVQGSVSGQRTETGYQGEVKGLSLATRDGIVVPTTTATLRYDNVSRREGGMLRADQLDLGALAALAGALPLPAQVHERLQHFAPQGRLTALEASWRGPVEGPTHWEAKTRFEGLALQPHLELPGFTGVSGSLEGDAAAGVLRIDSRQAKLDLPAVFPSASLPLTTLQAELRWRGGQSGIDFHLARAAFRNDDAEGEASGTYRFTGAGPGEIDLSARLTRADGNAVWRYMPLVVNSDARHWLQNGIIGGHSENATLRLKGPLSAFPFRDGKSGIFQVKGQIIGATLDYARGWPQITGIDGDLLFEGVRMVIRAARGNILGTALSNVVAEIPDLEQHEEMLHVRGEVRGQTQQFLDFIEASPVGARIQHFTESIQAKGNGDLDLRLDFPLRHIGDTQVQGKFRFAGNELKILPGLPLLTGVRGELDFTADQLQARGVRAQMLGAPVTVDVSTASGGMVRVDARGVLKAQGLRQSAEIPEGRWLDHLSGEANWRGSVKIKKPAAELRIETGLEGLSSSLPAPFNKPGRESLPLLVTGRIESGRSEFSASLGGLVALRMQEAGETWRGRAALGDAARKPLPPLPERGIGLAIVQPDLDLDLWRALLPSADSAASGPLSSIELRAALLRFQQRSFHDARIAATATPAGWRFAAESSEVRGQLNWERSGAGRLSGRLAFLNLPPASAPAVPVTNGTTQDMPAVDLVVDNFRVREMALGELRLAGENRDGAWQGRVELKSEAANLNSDLRWLRPGSATSETRANFRLVINNGEKLLGRLGLPDAMRRGNGSLKGELAWPGAPADYALEQLAGNLSLEMENGQFKKLEPGVGRLLGVLSLQSLPRRITLDFRDIFSEGFAFDSIAGSAKMAKGSLSTDELRIRGPAAKILLSGKVDLPGETQDLKVRIQPAVGESIAVGAMIAHPVAGAVAWAAQKILNDPLDQAFAYEYTVTGAWSDPKVERLQRAPTDAKPSIP